MRSSRFVLSSVAAAVAMAAALVAAGCSGGTVATTPLSVPTASGAPATFASIVGPPTTITTAAQAVSLPGVAGVGNVGGTVMMGTTAGTTSAIVTVASATSAGSAGGPPVTLQSSLRRAADAFGGGSVTPQYYVGVTNTGTGPTQVTIPTLNLNVNVPSGQSVGLAHFDPTLPQNGWNQHCAFGSGQVNTNGNSTTFTPGGTGSATFTIYPGATLWFAPYTYPVTTASPTSPPQSAAVTPTPAPAPASLTGTYVGSAQQTAPQSQGSQYLQLALTQSGSSISGTYAVLPSAGNQSGSFGSLSGTVSGGTVTLNATAQFGGTCTTTLRAVAAGTLLSGTFQSGGGTQTQGCSGSGNFSAVLQAAALPTVSGSYTGKISDSANGSGTLSFSVSTPGTVFSGTGTVTFPANPAAGGTSAIVGFVTSATTGEFAVINSGNGSQSCSPFGTLAITSNAASLTGTYTNSGGSGSTGCTAGGSFTITH
jgi:hypothetical protein